MDRILPKFSALGSLYHAEDPVFLQMALASLNTQTLKADEVVLVFDGPIGNKLSVVVEQWQASLNINIVKLEVNKGLGEALNYGLKACQHEYIARFDTDDINAPERFKKQLKKIVKEEADLVSSAIEEFSQTAGDLKRIRAASQTSSIKEQLVKRNVINHMTVLFKKSAVLEVGSYQHLHFMEDYYLWLRMQANGAKFIIMPEVLVDARIGNGMERRRAGLAYVKSELELAQKKYQLGYTSKVSGVFLFLLRATTRVLPISILKRIYKVFLRS